jgi:hypothetical protein
MDRKFGNIRNTAHRIFISLASTDILQELATVFLVQQHIDRHIFLFIGASNRDPAKLAKASAKVHPKTAKAPVYIIFAPLPPGRLRTLTNNVADPSRSGSDPRLATAGSWQPPSRAFSGLSLAHHLAAEVVAVGQVVAGGSQCTLHQSIVK